MKASRRVTIMAWMLLIASMAGVILTLRRVDQNRSGATLEDVLYISSPSAVKRLSLGYDGLLADIYWTRAVQYFGSKHVTESPRYDLLAPLLDITTTLDPHLLAAYQFGSNFLAGSAPDGAGMPEKAAQLVERGIRYNPNEWRLYYNLGFIYYMGMKDYGKAADAFARGSKIPNAHPFLRILAANMAQHAGDAQMARVMWTTSYQSTSDKMIRANAVTHLRALQVDEDVSALETAVSRYQLATGKTPASFSDLIRTGALRGIPVDPLGSPYVLRRDGRVEVDNPDKLPFIQFGKPLGYVPPAKPKFLPTD
jgi:hypothetical protein